MAEIRHLVPIETSPSVVYRAVTDEAGLRGWWTQEATVPRQVGAVAEFKFGPRYHNKMKIVRLEPDRVVEWQCLEGDAQWVGTTFVFAIERDGDSAVLRFTHGNWREATDFFAACNYKWGFYMQSLKAYCETGEGTPFREEDA